MIGRGRVSRNRKSREVRRTRIKNNCCIYCGKDRNIIKLEDLKEYLRLIFKRSSGCLKCIITRIGYTRKNKEKDMVKWKLK